MNLPCEVDVIVYLIISFTLFIKFRDECSITNSDISERQMIVDAVNVRVPDVTIGDRGTSISITSLHSLARGLLASIVMAVIGTSRLFIAFAARMFAVVLPDTETKKT